jgi:hypothetical protein
VLDAATSSLTTDPALASLRGLYELVRGLRHIPAERVQFLTVPRESYVYDANRDQLVEPEARRLFERLRKDAPVKVTEKAPKVSEHSHDEEPYEESENGDGTPAFRGNTAAQDTCG